MFKSRRSDASLVSAVRRVTCRSSRCLVTVSSFERCRPSNGTVLTVTRRRGNPRYADVVQQRRFPIETSPAWSFGARRMLLHSTRASAHKPCPSTRVTFSPLSLKSRLNIVVLILLCHSSEGLVDRCEVRSLYSYAARQRALQIVAHWRISIRDIAPFSFDVVVLYRQIC